MHTWKSNFPATNVVKDIVWAGMMAGDKLQGQGALWRPLSAYDSRDPVCVILSMTFTKGITVAFILIISAMTGEGHSLKSLGAKDELGTMGVETQEGECQLHSNLTVVDEPPPPLCAFCRPEKQRLRTVKWLV
jgi:hypothetical protein